MGKFYRILDTRRLKSQVPLLPVDTEKTETRAVLRKEAQTRQIVAELKGFAPVIPNR